MRIHIQHRTAYTYDPPAKSVAQILRMTPRSDVSQRIFAWRTNVDLECRLDAREDAFGNILHNFSLDGPISRLVITAEGDVETFDNAGMLSGAVERVPIEVFLRHTPLTHIDPNLREFAHQASQGEIGSLAQTHALMSHIHEKITFDAAPTDSGTTAGEALEIGRGVCQDFAHIFIACARCLGIPARYVSGYFLRTDGVTEQQAGHAWAEAWVDGLGWAGFDPANCICPHEQHVRVAIGLDYLGAAPVRGTRTGGGKESLDVRVRVLSPQRKPGLDETGNQQVQRQVQS